MVKLIGSKMVMVCVVWVDPHGSGEGGWRNMDEVMTETPGYAHTCGFLVQNVDGLDGHIKVALCIQQEIHKLNGVYIQKDADNADNMPQFVNISKRSKLKVVDDQ